MSLDYLKNKKKRGRSPSGEANNSFVKNVTSRVTGLLPATVTKWFSSQFPSSSSDTDVDDCTEDEATETQPAKRMRCSSPASKSSSPESTIEEIETTESISTSVLYNSIQSTRTSFRRDPSFVATPISSPNEETKIERTDRDSYHSQNSVSTIVHSIAPKRKSIFESTKTTKPVSDTVKDPKQPHTVKDPKQPCFKPNLFGSTFYQGQTMYGGASSSNFINHPNIRHFTPTSVNKTNANESIMSSSSRRVMELLENYSSPLAEAKRIPVITKSNYSANDSAYLDVSQSSVNNSLSYKTRELYVPGIASIMRLKKKSRLMNTTKAARQIIASHSSTLNSFPPYSDDTTSEQNYGNDSSRQAIQSKVTSKLKTRLTRTNRDDAFELPETVQLPTAVLQIDKDNLPKFTFGSTPQTSAATTSRTTFTQTNIPIQLNTSSALETQTPGALSSRPANEMFKFSSPVKISLDSHDSDSLLPKFTFGSPERGVDKSEPSKAESSTSVPNKIESPPVKDWTCPGCWVSNKPSVDKCPCCGTQQPSKVATNDKLTKPPDSNLSINTAPLSKLTKETESSKWKCQDCWVSNLETDEKCICCGSRNPSKSTVPGPIGLQKSKESVEKDWKCEDCWISNKSSVDKCAACGGAKSGTKSTAPSTVSTKLSTTTSNQTFNTIAKSQKESSWECKVCSVFNKNDKSTCACCGVDKPDGKEDEMKKLFNFSPIPNPTFKFGIDPKVQESNISKTVEQPKMATNSVEESETNNNVVSKIPTFTFTLPVKQPEEAKEVAKSLESKPTFTFGIPKQSTTNPVTVPSFTFKSPEPHRAVENKEKEKPQVVPKIEFKLPEQEVTKSMTGFFVPPSTSLAQNNAQDKPTISFPSFGNPINVSEKKDAPSNSLKVSSNDITASKPLTQSTFKFPSMGIPFGTMQSTATTTASSTTPIFQTSATTVAVPMFQNSGPSTSMSTMLFQKDQPTTAATSAPDSTGAGIFTFRSSTQNPAPPAVEKPNFNFTFGSNNSTENQNTGLFKPAFGSSTENNANKFSLPATNAIGNNALGSNALGNNSLGSNTLGNNTLGSNTLGSNTLGSNTLGSNTLGSSTLGGNTLGSNTLGSNTLGNNALGSNALGSNALGSNNLTVSNGLPSGNVLGSNAIGGNGPMAGSPMNVANQPSSNVLGGMQSGNSMSTTPSIFGTPIAKENNLWSNNSATTNNVFASGNMGTNFQSNNQSKPAPFTFRSSTPFNAGTAVPNQPSQNLFGTNPQPAQNVFGMASQNNAAQPVTFSAQPQNQPASNMFGAPQQAQNQVPSMNMFGTPSIASTPNFGGSSMTSFEAPSMTPTPPAAFNFGEQVTSGGVFGFGQQQQPPSAGVYNFGGAAGSATPGQIQFQMGSAPNEKRRVRKAVRRNPQR